MSTISSSRKSLGEKMSSQDRFQKLSAKIAQIQNLDTSQNVNKFSKLEQRLEDLEENFYKSFNLLEQKCDALKDQVSKITRIIEEEKVSKDNFLAKKNEELRSLDNKMMTYFYEQSEKIKGTEDSVYQRFEASVTKILSENKSELEHNKKNLELLKEYFDSEFSKAAERIDVESDSREKIIQNLIEQMNNEFGNLKKLAAETQQREENEEKILNTLKEVMKNIKTEMDAERKKKDEFEENIFNILDETCNKLSNNFNYEN